MNCIKLLLNPLSKMVIANATYTEKKLSGINKLVCFFLVWFICEIPNYLSFCGPRWKATSSHPVLSHPFRPILPCPIQSVRLVSSCLSRSVRPVSSGLVCPVQSVLSSLVLAVPSGSSRLVSSCLSRLVQSAPFSPSRLVSSCLFRPVRPVSSGPVYRPVRPI